MAPGQGLIKARRRLDDLFKTGVEIRFGGRYGKKGALAPDKEGPFPDSPRDDEIAMWVQPASPHQRDMALRNANAARARAVVTAKNDEFSEEHLMAMEFITDMSEETLYDYILISETDSRRQDAVREILSEDEWSNITELQDAMRMFEENETPEDDPEYIAVREQEKRLEDQVQKREKELRETAYEVLKMKGVASAQKQAIGRRSEIVASQAFMKEYELQMRYYSVRDYENHGVLFFESARDYAEQSDEVHELVDMALETMITDGNEAKNSLRAESGSDSSDLPSKPATSESSTPVESSE